MWARPGRGCDQPARLSPVSHTCPVSTPGPRGNAIWEAGGSPHPALSVQQSLTKRRENGMPTTGKEFPLLPRRSTLAHETQNPPLFRGSALFKPKITFCFLVRASSLIRSAALQTHLAHQLRREIKDAHCEFSSWNQRRHLGRARSGEAPAWVMDSREQAALRPI